MRFARGTARPHNKKGKVKKRIVSNLSKCIQNDVLPFYSLNGNAGLIIVSCSLHLIQHSISTVNGVEYEFLFLLFRESKPTHFLATFTAKVCNYRWQMNPIGGKRKKNKI